MLRASQGGRVLNPTKRVGGILGGGRGGQGEREKAVNEGGKKGFSSSPENKSLWTRVPTKNGTKRGNSWVLGRKKQGEKKRR